MDSCVKIPPLHQAQTDGALRFGGAELEPGMGVAIAGRNGAGKSVLLRSILRTMKGNIGWVSNYREPFLDMRVQEVIEIVQTQKNDMKIEAILQTFSLMALRHQAVNTLSDGEFMRLMLARVTAQDPLLFLLDEPDAHLDFYYKQELKDIVASWLKQGKVVIYSTHDESWVQNAQQVWWIEAGNVQLQSPGQFEFQKNRN